MITKTAIVVASSVSAVFLISAGLLFFSGSWSCRDGVWMMVGYSLLPKPHTACVAEKPTPPKICEPPWSCGRLARGEAGMRQDAWYLKYDDVTGPAQLEMIFASDAQCRIDDAIVDCKRMNPPSGTSSYFLGKKDGEIFRVSSLDFFKKK